MDSFGVRMAISVLLILLSAYFVAAEYSLVSARRSRLESMARKGNRAAKRLVKALDNVSPFIAGTQIGITMLGIAIGSFVEPFITDLLVSAVPGVDHRVSFVASFLLVAFVLVVIGELCPKYLALQSAEPVALFTFGPLRAISLVLTPLIWLAQNTSILLLRPFGIHIGKDHGSDTVAKEELLMLVQAGGTEGVLDKTHAEMVTRALRLDVLAAHDIMVHRLDVKWIDVSLDRQGVINRLKKIPYHRVPVCRGDIDDMVGIVYVHDVVKSIDDPDFSLEKIVRPVIAIPETLSMEKIVETMRTEKIQMLIVMDEYGGTSGLVTLEDVVEEVFGELEDRLESERAPIEEHPNHRYSIRADLRLDELIDRLHLNLEPTSTDTLAQIVVNELERVPRPGDSVETEFGVVRVENMARRRITRVGVYLKPSLFETDPEH